MRVYDESTRRRAQFCVQVNWSRERAFSIRQFNWIRDNIPAVRGVYVVYLRDDTFSYRRGRRESAILYFGSGWLDQRLSNHVDGTGSRALFGQIGEDRMAFRWAQIQDDDDHDWPVVVEGVLVYEFERLFGVLPPANQVRPPARPMLEFSLIDQHPFDVLKEL